MIGKYVKILGSLIGAFDGKEVLIRKCHFLKNNVRFGAGLFLKLCKNVTILDTVFQDNYASVSGGGTHIQECHTVISKNTSYLNNRARRGGSSATYKLCKVVVWKEFIVSYCTEWWKNLVIDKSKLVISVGMVVKHITAGTQDANLLSFKFTDKIFFISCQFLRNKRLYKGKGIKSCKHLSSIQKK